jgi:hypothetical protein
MYSNNPTFSFYKYQTVQADTRALVICVDKLVYWTYYCLQDKTGHFSWATRKNNLSTSSLQWIDSDRNGFNFHVEETGSGLHPEVLKNHSDMHWIIK